MTSLLYSCIKDIFYSLNIFCYNCSSLKDKKCLKFIIKCLCVTYLYIVMENF
ncbi:hypothetical protein C414_000220023 [Campylobacter jejuni subsp. jejuni 414]|nr:hypothetical protein C414_000220023 [Campylobacter jejuni subsp. jejuni 414]